MQKTALGAVLSTGDYRDKIVTKAVGAPIVAPVLPATFDKTLSSTVLMQALEPACVSNSAVDNLKLWWFIKHGEWVDFSPRFLDILAKRYDGQPIDGGTFPRLVFKLMAQYGCATTATLPNDTTLPIPQYRNDALLTPAVFAEAAKYKTPGYFSVPLDFVSTRQAIYLYGAISSLFLIGEEFWTPSWADGDIDPLRTPKSIVGGHQLTPHGWTGSTFNLLRNSWSDAWANKGDAQYDPKVWAPFLMEQWAIAEIPQDVADFIAMLPSPSGFHYTWNTNLKMGDVSEDVKFLQVAYMILGWLKPIAPEEFGIFGPKTGAANFAYQSAKKITPTSANDVGPLTRAALNKDFAL